MSIMDKFYAKLERGRRDFFDEPSLYLLQIFVGFVICFVIFCFLQLFFG